MTDEPVSISLDSIKSKPLINIILPAWKEGENFKKCLKSIKRLKYPKLKVILNAGGNEKTIQIAKSFEKYKNFVILRQLGGADRPSLGKIKAINKCLDYVEEGIIYFIDADAIITDENILRMVHAIVNLNKNVVISNRSLTDFLKKKDLAKYLIINRNPFFTSKLNKNDYRAISGSNTCITMEVMKKIENFSEEEKFATDKSMAIDIHNAGYKIYHLIHYKSRMQNLGMPITFKTWKRQRTIWLTNKMIYSFKFKKIKIVLKFFFLIIASLYLLVFPILIIFSINLFMLGIYLFLWIYLKKIRKIIFYKKTTKKQYQYKIKNIFYLKLIGFYYMEIIINILIIYDVIKYLRYLKKND
jgi:glycosyltransferase involved in cell wall biosynthesis